MSELYTCHESVLGLRARSRVWGQENLIKTGVKKKQNWGEVKPQERQPPAQEDTSQSTDPAGRPLLLPHSPTQGTWSHQLLPGPWLRALGRRRRVKVAPPTFTLSSPPTLPIALPFPIVFWGGQMLRAPQGRRGGPGPRRAGKGAQGWGCSPRPDCGRNRHSTGLWRATARPSS